MDFLTDNPFSASQALSDFETQIGDAGGVVSFTGHVRTDAAKGRVTTLHLQHHPKLTEAGIAKAKADAEARWPLTACKIIHRIGDMSPGEAIVFVATASKHRRDAFEAADFLMDYLKTEAVFWKKETTETGVSWIEPRHKDYEDSKRWKSMETR